MENGQSGQSCVGVANEIIVVEAEEVFCVL